MGMRPKEVLDVGEAESETVDVVEIDRETEGETVRVPDHADEALASADVEDDNDATEEAVAPRELVAAPEALALASALAVPCALALAAPVTALVMVAKPEALEDADGEDDVDRVSDAVDFPLACAGAVRMELPDGKDESEKRGLADEDAAADVVRLGPGERDVVPEDEALRDELGLRVGVVEARDDADPDEDVDVERELEGL